MKKNDSNNKMRANIPQCIEKMLEGAAATNRDKVCLELTKYFRNNLPEQQVKNLLMDWNKKNNPPFAEADITTRMKEAFKERAVIDCDNIIISKYCDQSCPKHDDNSMENVVMEIKEIVPAQDFKEGIAYVTVPFLINGKNCSTFTEYCLITSERKKIKLTPEKLSQNQLHFFRYPRMETSRWSMQSIKDFLSGRASSNIADTFNVIKNLISQHVDLEDKRWNTCLACWIIGTYFHRMFESFPYIHLNGHRGSGKTKALTIAAGLAFNAELTVIASSAFITDNIHNNSITCCIDEAESLRTNSYGDNDRQTVISMYNAGYKKGVKVGKMLFNERANMWLPVKLEGYSPKMFAGIKYFEGSLASRCIPITMTLSDNQGIINRPVRLNDPIYQKLRDELYLILMSKHNIIENEYNNISDNEIAGREWELWQPLLTIAKTIDGSSGTIYAELKQLALDIQKQRKEALIEDTTSAKLIVALLDMMTLGQSETNYTDDPKERYYTSSYMRKFLENRDDFAWLKDNKKINLQSWLGDELRKAGAIKGRAKQRKINGQNERVYYLNYDTLLQRLKVYGITYDPPEASSSAIFDDNATSSDQNIENYEHGDNEGSDEDNGQGIEEDFSKIPDTVL